MVGRAFARALRQEYAGMTHNMHSNIIIISYLVIYLEVLTVVWTNKSCEGQIQGNLMCLFSILLTK